MSKLLEVAQGVFNNWEDVMKVMLAEPCRPRPQDPLGRGRDRGQGRRPDVKANTGERFRLRKNQCTHCKKKGHWRNECPEKGKTQEKIAPLVLLEDAE